MACEAPKNDKVLILAVQHLQRELKDANQLISVLSQTKHSQELGNILLPLKSSDYLKSNQISVSSLYTTMVSMESELREEREKHSNLALEFDREKNLLVKDLSILISESKRSEDTLKKLRLELDNQHEVIRSCQAASESVEKIKLLEEEIIKEKAKVVEEQTNILKCSRIQKTLTSTGRLCTKIASNANLLPRAKNAHEKGNNLIIHISEQRIVSSIESMECIVRVNDLDNDKDDTVKCNDN